MLFRSEYAFKCAKLDFNVNMDKIMSKDPFVANKNKVDNEIIYVRKVIVFVLSNIIGKKDINEILCNKYYSRFRIIKLNQREKKYAQRMTDYIYHRANKLSMNDFENFI